VLEHSFRQTLVAVAANGESQKTGISDFGRRLSSSGFAGLAVRARPSLCENPLTLLVSKP